MNADAASAARRLIVDGRVQGVGFRPFVYRLALHHGLSGWVRNRVGEVEIRVAGPASAIAAFERDLVRTAPPLARPRLRLSESAPAVATAGFRILESERDAAAVIHVPPDYFACDDCVRELRDPRNRRYRYPFINCTQCGPRYTLIERLPYDRPNTTMAGFALCPACRREYEDPADRRFHAEPVACPVCGPRLEFRDAGDTSRAVDALAAAVTALRAGKIVAVKGIGGYHLMCDATNEGAVALLRATKPRPHKPLAVMFPMTGADGLDAVRASADLSSTHAQALRDPMRPIVLVGRRDAAPLAASVAPGLREIGAFLPYSPLHHLLLDDFGGPLVATSANVSGEPVLTDNAEVESRLGHVAQAYLHHDRAIARPADDPVYRVIAGAARPLRLGRGNAPLELTLPFGVAAPTLAVGSHMKNTIALAWENRVVVSPHVGDLDSPRSVSVLEQVIADLQQLYGVTATRVVCDAHAGYASTRWARRSGLPVTTVYHHRAHAAALAGEFADVTRWLVFTWDGVGLGEDGTLWGGEALLGKPGDWSRVASMRPFHLPGGEKAGREPWRSAAALCWEAGIAWPDCPEETSLLHAAWQKRINAPTTSAVGRLFDAAASLTGLNHRSSFEGQGPMLVESTAVPTAPVTLPLAIDNGVLCADWAPLLAPLLDVTRPVAERAGMFHASLAHALLDQARRLRAEHGAFTVGLTGGVFQNRLLAETALALLERDGFAARLGVTIPCNDAGISYGQIIEFSGETTSK